MIDRNSDVPLKEQIRHWIARGIGEGVWKEGESIPSINEISRRFQVARETVRLALNGLVQDNVLIPRQGRGFYVNERKSRILQIAIMGKIDGVYIRPIYHGLTREIGNKASVLLVDPRNSIENAVRIAKNLVYNHHVDRLLVIPPRGMEKDMSAALAPLRRLVRIAWLDRGPTETGEPVFQPDYPACVRLAVRHLRDCDMKAIRYFSRNPDDQSVFHQMRDTFFRMEDRRVIDDWEEIAEFVKKEDRGVGILAETDTEAAFLMTGLQSAGIRIPEDVMIVSCDNGALTENLIPAITAVDPGFTEIGVQAAHWILHGPQEHDAKIQIQPKIVMRKTTVLQPFIEGSNLSDVGE